MTIPANAIYQTDCLALFERLESEQMQLIYIDPPLHVDVKKAIATDFYSPPGER